MPRLSTVALVLVSALVLHPAAIGAQAQSATPAATPAADPKDVASVDAIIAALYDVISGPAGKARNWDRFKSLFVPGARLIPTAMTPDKHARLRVITPDDYASQVGSRLEAGGFFEHEIARTSDAFGNITHVFSTYESRRAASDAQPFARGINSIQLFTDGARWWVVTVLWDSERADNRFRPSIAVTGRCSGELGGE